MKDITLEELERLSLELGFQGSAREYAKHGIILPAFVREDLSDRKGQIILSYENGSYRVSNSDEEYPSFSAAYDSNNSDSLLIFDESLKESPEPLRFDFGMVMLPEGGSNGKTRLFSGGYDDIDLHTAEYVDFLIAHKKWKAKQDISTAWDFVARHPAFWHKTKSKKPMWNLSGGWDDVAMGVYYHDEDGIRAYIEHGTYIEEEDYQSRYADILLVAFRPTMDEAIIAFAEKVEEIHGINHESTPEADALREAVMDRIMHRGE